MDKEITLLQALTGVDFTITHLDGSKIRVINKPGEVIKPDDIKTIEGKGLPFHKQSFKFGNLFIAFKVSFPTNIPAAQLSTISSALVNMKKQEDADMDAVETFKLSAYSEA